MRRTALLLAFVASTGLTACNSKKKDHSGRGQQATTSAVTSGSYGVWQGEGNGSNPYQGNLITSLTPDRGSASGQTEVTIRGTGFAQGAVVEFGAVAATQVVVVSVDTIVCRTPAHAPGTVDVTITLPGGVSGTRAQAFTFEPAGPLARVADIGNLSGEEQELVERANRARRDPPAEQRRLEAKRTTYEPIYANLGWTWPTNLDFSNIAAQPPLTPNQFLSQASKAHVDDMHARGFYGHQNPDGVNANGRIMATAYDLHTQFGTNPAVNLTENLGKGQGGPNFNLMTTAERVHDTFLLDPGLAIPKHRQIIMGMNTFSTNREIGLSYQHLASGDYCVQEFARTKTDRPFVTGVAFNDVNRTELAEAGEGRPNVTVTLTHASGFSITTQTATAGGFGFEILVDGDYTLTIDGRSTQVTVTGRSVKVDLRDGALVTY